MSCNNNCCCNDCCEEIPTGLEACEQLNQYNNEELKSMVCYIDMVDWCKNGDVILKQMITKIWCLFHNIIRQICAIWDILLDNDGYVTKTEVFTTIVSSDKFVQVNGSTGIWWSGSPEKDESYISIPVASMDIVDGVSAQVMVMGNRVHPVTVAVQDSERQGDNLIVNFDTYEIKGAGDDAATNGVPFEVAIKFIVVGRKKFGQQ